MGVIHMDTERTRSFAQQMVRTSETIYENAQTFLAILNNIDWQGPSRDAFVAEAAVHARSLEALSQACASLGMRANREIDEWLGTDCAGADGIANLAVLTSLAALSPTATMAEFENTTSTGQVLGVSTGAIDYQKLSWSDKFSQQEALATEIGRLESQLISGLPTNLDDVDAELADIERRIAALEAEKAEAQKNADHWWNQVVPDWPLEGDHQDGVPWRVRADDYEDQVQNFDQQIAELMNQREQLNQQRMAIMNLDYSKDSKASLDRLITDGIAADGPSEKHPYFPGTTTSNCTKYASLKRDVPCSGHAHTWNDQAAKNGFEVGASPVKGAVMVWEPAVRGAHDVHGHVSIVEKVETMPDGSIKVFYTDNGNNDSTHPSTIVMQPGESGISFIYGKLNTSTA